MSLTLDDGADDGWAGDASADDGAAAGGAPSWISANYLLGARYPGGYVPAGQDPAAAAAGVLPTTIDSTLATPVGTLTRDPATGQADGGEADAPSAGDGSAEDAAQPWTSDKYRLSPRDPGGFAPAGQDPAAAAAGVLPTTIDRTLTAPVGTLTRDHVIGQAADMLGALPPEQFAQLLGPAIGFVSDLPDDEPGLRDGLERIRAQFPASGGTGGASADEPTPGVTGADVPPHVTSDLPSGNASDQLRSPSAGAKPVQTKSADAGRRVAQRGKAQSAPQGLPSAAGGTRVAAQQRGGRAASSYPLPPVIKLPNGQLVSDRTWTLDGTPYRVIYDSSGCHIVYGPVTPEEVRKTEIGRLEADASAGNWLPGLSVTLDNLSRADMEKQLRDVLLAQGASAVAALLTSGRAARGGGWATPEEEGVPTIGGRRPINSAFAGGTHPSGVRYTEQGFPDFSPYAKLTVGVQGLTGRYRPDAKMANQIAGLRRTPNGHVWHHHEDGYTMQLLPRDIHDAAEHTGGAAVVRNGGLDQ